MDTPRAHVESKRSSKVQKVKAWLATVFPGHEVHDFPDRRGRDTHNFRIEHTEYGLLTLTEQFIDEQLDDDERQIAATMEGRRIAPMLREVGRHSRVVVTRGIYTEPIAHIGAKSVRKEEGSLPPQQTQASVTYHADP